MSKIKGANAVLYITLAILVGLVGLFKLGESVNTRLRATPIKTVTKAESVVVAESKREIYPVWVVQATARQAAVEEGSVENIFGKEVVVDPLVELEMQRVATKLSRAELFQQTFAITGYGFKGVFVGQDFYREGEPMRPLTFTDADGTSVTPVLTAVKNGQVTIDLAGQKLLIKDRIGAPRGTT
ncbi:hypothetical protein [Hydrogenophaga sp. 2FB]|uniref:hypothetical protein n=1 Tax=Hydrogenophaga sp. 2FB TaxID=2502187 RepID=UPI0010FA17A1|nr:hypothetical protein [Hydrogenophaga sp. 2FB]